MIDFELSKPITLSNGDSVTTLKLDFDLLSLSDLKTAQKIKSFITDTKDEVIDVNKALAPRLDESLRISLAWVAAMKSDKRISLNDVLQLSAKDALLLSEEAATSYFF